MSKNKAEILQQISSYTNKLNSLNTKIEMLQMAKKKLEDVDSTIKYELTDHGTIKSLYHLAGVKYANYTENEVKALESLSSKFTSERGLFIDAINAKINTLNTEVGSCELAIASLKLDL